MWFNSMQREEPYLGLKSTLNLRKQGTRKGGCTGAAWLSSARAVRCLVKSSNERNPWIQLPAHNGGNSGSTAYASSEEGGDDVKSSWPLRLGQHTCYNGIYNAQQDREVERIAKKMSQFGSESATRLREVGIASNRGSAHPGEYVPGPCTHRPSRHESRGHPKPPHKRLR